MTTDLNNYELQVWHTETEFGHHEAITWNSGDLLWIEPSETNFNEIWMKMLQISLKKMFLKVSSAEWHAGHFV